MNKLLLLSFLCLGIFINAQNERFYYEYKSVKDSTEKENISKEMMILEITKNGSNFYNYTKYKRDSTTIAKVLKENAATTARATASVQTFGDSNEKVSKAYPDYKVSLHTTISGNAYKIPDERKIEWKIQQEKQKIGEWETQKATAEFAGRQWIAWYTEEIPLPDGPYKFHGLPGLIVKVEDTKGYHSFELKGISKIKDNIGQSPEIIKTNEIEIDRKKHKKLFWEDREDPAREMKQKILNMANNNTGNVKTVVKFSVNGETVTDPNQMIKYYEQSAKEKVRKDNNHLELDMLTK